MSRKNTFYSLGLMPALMGVGHLAPAIGAIQAITGSYQFPVKLLGLIGALSAIVDCKWSFLLYSLYARLLLTSLAMDTYKDLSPSDRPSKLIWNIWVYGVWSIVLACTLMLDLKTVYDIYRVLPLGLLWGIPCVPAYTATKGWILSKPKTLVSV